MGQSLSLQLSDEAFAALRLLAESTGTSPAQVAAATLEGRFGAGRPSLSEAEATAAAARFERHFGELGPGDASELDNDGIDADLAREYADSHEDP